MAPVKLIAKPASDFSLEKLAEIATAGYAGYIGGNQSLDQESLGNYVAGNGVSIDHAMVFYAEDNEDEPVGIAALALRGDDKPGHARLAIMGIVADARGKGFGLQAMNLVIEAERRHGTKVIELETIQKNAAAVGLYKKVGFEILQDLPHMELPLPDEPSANDDVSLLEEGTLDDVDAVLKAHGTEDLPWQTAMFRTSKKGGRAFKLGHAHCVVGSSPKDDGTTTNSVQLLIVEPDFRGKGEATRLCRAVMAKLPADKWVITPHYPKRYVEPLARKFGFQMAELSQYQMRLKLD